MYLIFAQAGKLAVERGWAINIGMYKITNIQLYIHEGVLWVKIMGICVFNEFWTRRGPHCPQGHRNIKGLISSILSNKPYLRQFIFL